LVWFGLFGLLVCRVGDVETMAEEIRYSIKF